MLVRTISWLWQLFLSGAWLNMVLPLWTQPAKPSLRSWKCHRQLPSGQSLACLNGSLTHPMQACKYSPIIWQDQHASTLIMDQALRIEQLIFTLGITWEQPSIDRRQCSLYCKCSWGDSWAFRVPDYLLAASSMQLVSSTILSRRLALSAKWSW